MYRDYHTHPMVLQTPERFDAFVQQALARGIREICVTDHMPLSISHASDRIPTGQIAAYCRRVRELASRYEGIFSIKCGIEIDYHPSVLGEIESVLAEGDFDYLLCSSHMHVFRTDYENYTHNDFARLALENALLAVESRLFDTLAHPDMYRWLFLCPDRFPLKDDGYAVERHTDLIVALLDAVKTSGMCLEINPHLAEAHENLDYTYPERTIVRMALDRGIRFRYGSDAHKPQSVGIMLDTLMADPLYGKALADQRR